MAHDVFISYSSHDKTTADGVCARLEARNIRCWIAPRDVTPGRPFAGEITSAIESCKVLVLVFSASSNLSPYVASEVDLAFNQRLPVIPFRIEEVLPSGEMRFYLNRPHWLNAWTPPLEAHVEVLAASIERILRGAGVAEVIPQATVTVPAPTPQEGQPHTIRTYVARMRDECTEKFSTQLMRPDRLYVPQFAAALAGNAEPFSLPERMRQFWAGAPQRLAVLGNYGMGKTYFTWRTVLQALEGSESHREQRLPVLFPLRKFDYGASVPQEGREREARDIITQVQEHAVALDFPRVSRGEFIRWIEDGVVGIVLDGLDELSLPRHVKWREALGPLLAINGLRLLVTSRPSYLQDPARELDGFDACELLAWSDREWEQYLAFSAPELEQVGGVDQFRQEVSRRKGLQSLTSRPLWCYMIVSVSDQIANLPDLALSGLYQAFLDRAITRRPRMDDFGTLGWLYCAMERFAEECVRTAQNTMEEDALAALLSRVFESIGHKKLKEFVSLHARTYAFLNCDRARRYSFGHLSFEDYFCAAGVARWLVEKSTGYESGPPEPVPHEPIIFGRRLSDDQALFLAGIFQEHWIPKSLGMFPDEDIRHFQSKLLQYLQRELGTDDEGPALRANLFRLYLDVLRGAAEGGRPLLQGVQMTGANLAGLDFSNCDLQRIDFTNAVLARARFRDSRISACTFFGAQIDGADFSGADVSGADFVGVEQPSDPPILAALRGLEKARLTEREKERVFPGVLST